MSARAVPFPLFRRFASCAKKSSLAADHSIQSRHPAHPVSLHSRPRFRHLITLLPFVYPCPSLGNVRSCKVRNICSRSRLSLWSTCLFGLCSTPDCLLRLCCTCFLLRFCSSCCFLSFCSTCCSIPLCSTSRLLCLVCCDSTCRLLCLFCFTFRFFGLFCSAAAGSRLLSVLPLLCLFSRPTGFRFFSSCRLLCLSPCRLLWFCLLSAFLNFLLFAYLFSSASRFLSSGPF